MTFEVKVSPKSGRDEISGFADGILKVRVSAPPSQGKANERLISLISSAIRVPRSSITIARGKTSRIKSVGIEGVSETKFNKFRERYSAQKQIKQQ